MMNLFVVFPVWSKWLSPPAQIRSPWQYSQKWDCCPTFEETIGHLFARVSSSSWLVCQGSDRSILTHNVLHCKIDVDELRWWLMTCVLFRCCFVGTTKKSFFCRMTCRSADSGPLRTYLRFCKQSSTIRKTRGATQNNPTTIVNHETRFPKILNKLNI